MCLVVAIYVTRDEREINQFHNACWGERFWGHAHRRPLHSSTTNQWQTL